MCVPPCIKHCKQADTSALRRIHALTTRYRTVTRSAERASEFTALAQQELADFPPSPARESLHELTNMLLARLN